MRLTWKDAGATVLVGAGGGLYAWHLAAPDLAVVGSSRWVALGLFVLGVAACATGASYSDVGLYARTMSSAGAVAFALLVTTLVTGSATVLAVLAALTGVMWLVTTGRHALGIYPPRATATAPDGSHETIEARQYH